MTTKGNPTNQAIPYYLRAMRGTRPPQWVSTPQGDILRHVESRLQTIFTEERQFDILPDLIAELGRIAARAEAVVLDAKAKELEEVKRREAAERTVKQPKLPEPTSTPEDEVYNLLKAAMREYIKTGDITTVVPTGFFASKEEADIWSQYTMARITSIKGRTVHAMKLSKDVPLNAVVLKEGVTASVGKCAVLQDKNRLIIDVVMLPEKEADQLSRTFNALYRR